MPIRIKDRVAGVFNVNHAKENAFSDEALSFFESLAQLIATAMENARLYEEARRLSNTDPLTGLYNHGFFKKALDIEVEKSKRHGHPLSLLMIDIDFFKKVNDTFGHGAGDKALKQLSDLFKTTCRKIDVVARYGGEEFSVIGPETDKDEARALAERIRKMTADNTFSVNGPEEKRFNLTVSIGIASCPRHTQDPDRLIVLADRALYMAKDRGRDMISIYKAT